MTTDYELQEGTEVENDPQDKKSFYDYGAACFSFSFILSLFVKNHQERREPQELSRGIGRRIDATSSEPTDARENNSSRKATVEIVSKKIRRKIRISSYVEATGSTFPQLETPARYVSCQLDRDRSNHRG